METPPPQAPASGVAPPAPVHQTQYALYQFNQTDIPNGLGTYVSLDEMADSEVASINTYRNIELARIRDQEAAQARAERGRQTSPYGED